MGRCKTALIPIPVEGESMSAVIAKCEPTEEERVFRQFCDHVDAHLKWRGQPPIASTDQERRERAMLYMLKSIEAYRWFAELVGGLDMLEKLLGGSTKKKEVADVSASTERAVSRRSRFVVNVHREANADDE